MRRYNDAHVSFFLFNRLQAVNMRLIKLTVYFSVYPLALITVLGCAVTSTQSASDAESVSGSPRAEDVENRLDLNDVGNAGASLAGVELSAHVQENVRAALSKVAQDFVHALQQIPSHLPASTTIQIPRTDTADSITQSFKAAFESGGYGVRIVDVVASDNVFQYRLEDESIDDASGRHRFEIAVGDLEMRRTYGGLLISNVHPVTPLYVRGADASQVILNDAAFVASSQDKLSTTSKPLDEIATSTPINPGALTDGPSAQTSETFVAARIDEPLEIIRETQSRTPLSVADEINPLQNMVSAQYGAGTFSLPLVALPEVQNVFELGTSNYIDVLTELEIVAQRTLTFPNDSLRLGNINKQLVENMVTRYQPSTDVFSVIGCSMGPTG